MHMLCFKYKKLLIPYIENELEDGLARNVERHLSKCARCRRELDSILSMSGILRNADISAMEPASDLWAKVSARIADEKPKPAVKSAFRINYVVYAAAVVILAAVGFNFMHGNPKVSEQRASTPKLAPAVMAKVPPVPEKSIEPEKTAERNQPVIDKTPKEQYMNTRPRYRKIPKYSPRPKPVYIASNEKPHSAEPVTPVDNKPVMMADASTAVKSTRSECHFDTDANAESTSAVTGSLTQVASTGITVFRGIARPSACAVDAGMKVAAVEAPAVDNKDIQADSIVDTLNETEGVRVAAIFAYP